MQNGIVRSLPGVLRARRHRRLLIDSRLFDPAWYLSAYPHVAIEQIDPVLHYVVCGAAEGRDPSQFFDSDWYLAQNADVARSKANPLVHYLMFGAAEGRLPKPAVPRTDLPSITVRSAELAGDRTAAVAAVAASAIPYSPLTNRAAHLKKFVHYPTQPKLPLDGLPPADPQRLKITWIVPDFAPGAGGHMTIFRIAHYLRKFGHELSS